MSHLVKPMFNLFLLVFMLNSVALAAAENSTVEWHPWSDAIFEQAKRENKLVILDLEAVWCHWCHVMDEKTYHDPVVVKLIQQKYIAIRVDQDANPDISIRYEDYGWPATVIFAADGSELVKRRGYIAPENMAKLLQAVIDDPTAGPSIKKQSALIIGTQTAFSSAQRDKIIADINRGYDTELGGWGNVHKFILAQNVEYALIRAKQGDKALEKKARETLDNALSLIDPVWGGVYQYSDRGRWDSPHFEKIMSIQTDDLRLYSLAYKQFNDSRYLHAAQGIAQYLTNFLSSPEGAFYTSQDADASAAMDGHLFYSLDNKHRRALQMPHIDTNSYARENGWAIRSFVSLYDATGDKTMLERATLATNWVEANRSLVDGGFRHAAQDRAGPYLGDTLAMAEAYLALYTSTGDSAWLTKARLSVSFIQNNFKAEHGFSTTAKINKSSQYVFTQPLLQMEENVSIARLANQLTHYTADAKYREMALHAMKYLVALADPNNERYLAGAITAADELTTDPAHITIVGAKSDPVAQALYQKALQIPVVYRRIEWWDKAAGPMPNSDVQYPQLSKAAAFICVNHACSTPIYEVDKLNTKANSLLFSAD